MRSLQCLSSFARLAALTAILLAGADEALRANGFAFETGGSWRTPAMATPARVVSAPVLTRVAMTLQIGPTPYPGGSLTAFFDRGGLLGAFAAGFLGSGVLGVLFGRGLFGGLSGDASYVGLSCQLGLLIVLCWLIWTRWHRGAGADAAARSPRQLADAYVRSRSDHYPEGDSSGGDSTAKTAPVAARLSEVSEVSMREGRR